MLQAKPLQVITGTLLKNIGKSTKINMQPVLPGDGKIKTRLVIVPKVFLPEDQERFVTLENNKYLFYCSFEQNCIKIYVYVVFNVTNLSWFF